MAQQTNNLDQTPDINDPVDINTLEQAILSQNSSLAPNGIKRDPDPNATEAQKRQVKFWQSEIERGKRYWKADFERMREDQKFAYGLQWDGQKQLNGSQDADGTSDRYVANIVHRHIQQRVAALYAKNPRAVARRRDQILNTVWDGTNQGLQIAQAQIQALQSMLPQLQAAAMQGDMNGLMGIVTAGIQAMPEAAQAQTILQDAENVRQQSNMLDTIAKTLELVQEYTVEEQAHDFKLMMKMVVRRAITTGVGYVKVGYQRIMQRDPDKEAQINDLAEQLSVIKRRAADLADGKISEDSPEVAALQDQLKSLQEEPQVLVREGVVYDYPASTAVIPDPKTINLREFLGADWVAQEYCLSVDEIKEIYEVDVSGSAGSGASSSNPYANGDRSEFETLFGRENTDRYVDDDRPDTLHVWEVYSRKDGLVFHICEGYPDFLREPAKPEVYIERFWPWFAFVPNECDMEGRIFPPSDVRLLRDMQNELNRSRQMLREHRLAARPKTAVASGVLSKEDKEKLQSHPANAVLELDGLSPGQKVGDVLQPFTGPSIDPNLYDTNGVYQDSLRVSGTQEANLGGMSKGTATESQIAEASRMNSVGSNVDDLDDLLTQVFRASGQILLLEMSEATAKKIAGPGAIWPSMTKADVAQEIYLEVEAGSMGRPNKAQDIQNAERIMPLLMQIPGVNPEFLIRELIRRLDDRLDVTQAMAANTPSITAMNTMRALSASMPMHGAPAGPGGPPQSPQAQGPQGAMNGAKPPMPGGANGPDMTRLPKTQTQAALA